MECLADCPPPLLPMIAFFVGLGVIGLFGARWRRWTLFVSLPVLFVGGGFLFPTAWPDAVVSSLQLGSLLLPLLGALMPRPASPGRGGLTSA